MEKSKVDIGLSCSYVGIGDYLKNCLGLVVFTCA